MPGNHQSSTTRSHSSNCKRGQADSPSAAWAIWNFYTDPVPPTQAEEMYNPEVFGRTGASSFEVR